MRTGLHDRRWELDFGKGGRSTATATKVLTTQEEFDRGPSTGTSTNTGDSSLRRTVSSEDTRSLASSHTSPPPHPPPKDPIPRRPPDSSTAYGSSGWGQSPTILQTVRMKMSNDDQEAMRKLRLTMDMSESGTGTGSSRGGSPLSPNFGESISSHSHSHSHGHGRPPMGSRRTTLSRQMISEDLDDEPTPPKVEEHVSTNRKQTATRTDLSLGPAPFQRRLRDSRHRTQGRRQVDGHSTSYKSLGRLESSDHHYR